MCYLSAEFLIGRSWYKTLSTWASTTSSGRPSRSRLDFNEWSIRKKSRARQRRVGRSRLFMESLATLGVPAIGYGFARVRHLRPGNRDGWQMEVTDKWLRWGNPWEVALRDLLSGEVRGWTGHTTTDGRYRVRWIPNRVVTVRPARCRASATGRTTNLLRCGRPRRPSSFDFAASTAAIPSARSRRGGIREPDQVLYPNDRVTQGKQLRLEQQYFFVSCSLRPCCRCTCALVTRSAVHQHFVAQLNDTHPSIAGRN